MLGKFFLTLITVLLGIFNNLCLPSKCSKRLEVLIHDDEIQRLSCEGPSVNWYLRDKQDRYVGSTNNLTLHLDSTSCGNYYCRNVFDNTTVKDALILTNGKSLGHVLHNYRGPHHLDR